MKHCSKCVMPDTRPGIKFVRLSEFERAQGVNLQNSAKADKSKMGGFK